MGEFQVNLLIQLFLPKVKYHLIKNVTIPTEDGTTQIDHIVVSKYGIFIIETKNMKGWIFGKPSQKQWTQKIFKQSFKFQNPLHQNYKHIKTLESYLDVDPNSLHSVIIFIGDSTFKTEMPDNVTYARAGIEYIKSKRHEYFSNTQALGQVIKIENLALERGRATNKAHIAHIKEKKAQVINVKVTTAPVSNLVTSKEPVTAIIKETEKKKACPKCGSLLTLRKAKRGKNRGNKFWGCTSYPKCKTIVACD
jgi:hypothetical protein